jgi:hypothetical protein
MVLIARWRSPLLQHDNNPHIPAMNGDVMTARRATRVAILLAALIGTVGLAAPPATAAPTGQRMIASSTSNRSTTAAACTVNSYTPTKIGSSIYGGGNVSTECRGYWFANLQRERWNGWETIAGTPVFYPGGGSVASYNCAGTGTHTFRTHVWNNYGEGAYSGKFRTSC